jgi:hypothetical protein
MLGEGHFIVSAPQLFFIVEIWNWSDFGGFQLPEVRKNTSKNFQISILDFQCVARRMIEAWYFMFGL